MSLTNTVRTDLKKTLRNRGLTQDAFARKYDLSSSWLNKFLRGETDNPQIRTLERLQQALTKEKTTTRELQTGTGP